MAAQTYQTYQIYLSVYLSIYLSIISLSVSLSIFLYMYLYLLHYPSKLQNTIFINIHRNKSKETKNLWNAKEVQLDEKKNQIELKILLSSSRLVKFSFTSFLNKGTVQRFLLWQGKCYSREVEHEMKLLIWRNTLDIDV